MPRIPLLHLLAIALCALALGAAPALAAAPAAASPVATASVSDDDWEDVEDWADDECADDDDACWDEADDLCFAAADDDEWGDWEGAEAASGDEWDDWSDDEDWGDDEDWSDEECADDEAGDDDAEAVAPARLSKLQAKPVRRGDGVRVSFRLDRGGDVVLALRRVKGAHVSGRCAHGARAAKRSSKPSGRDARRCPRPRALLGTTTMSGRGGANATVLRRWKGRRLESGRYRLTATPAMAGARAATTTFTLKAAGRRR